MRFKPLAYFHPFFLAASKPQQGRWNRGAGGSFALTPNPSPNFGRSNNPIPTVGGQIMPTRLLLAPPYFHPFFRAA